MVASLDTRKIETEAAVYTEPLLWHQSTTQVSVAKYSVYATYTTTYTQHTRTQLQGQMYSIAHSDIAHV